MKLEDKSQFITLMTSIAELYNKKLSKLLFDIYWRCLEPYPLTLISTALKAHILHPDGGQFMPKPADILRIVNGDHETRALQAWSKVLQAIHIVGSYDSVVFDDPIIHLAIMDLGGWIELCQQDSKSLVFIGKQFEKLYSGYLQKIPASYPKQLTGQIEHHNTQIGQLPKTLRLLGNKAKALQVWQSGCNPATCKQSQAGISIDTSQLEILAYEANSHMQHDEVDHNNALTIHSGDKHCED